MATSPRELIIDGYNVIFRLAPEARRSLPEIRRLRGMLEREMTRLGELQAVKPWIIYDGQRVTGAHPESFTGEHLRVSYVEPPAEADDAIVQMAEQAVRDGQPTLVVTSDEGLARRLRAVGSRVESAEEFAGSLETEQPEKASAQTGAGMGEIHRHFMGLHRIVGEVVPRAPQSSPAGVVPEPEARAAPAKAVARRPATQTAADAAGSVAARTRRQERGRARQEKRLQSRKNDGGKKKKKRRH